MPHLEIEKRYLCNSNDIINFLKKSNISYIVLNLEQFYLVAKPDETLRFRKEGNRYIKNQKYGTGLTRKEIEENISKKEYLKAKKQNLNGVIKKVRYKFKFEELLYELDIFKGRLKGLSILEVEFKDIYSAKNFKLPSQLNRYIIKDITNENIYSNAALSKSMKIPLRSDSKLSLNEILKSCNIIKPKLDLYISDYENSKYALLNSIDRLFFSYKINISNFVKYNLFKDLKRANRSLLMIKSLLNSHKKYIKQKSFNNTLIALNSLILLFEETISLHITIKQLIKIKSNSPIDKKNEILKEIIQIAQKERINRNKIKNYLINNNVNEFKKVIERIEFKNIEKPFFYLKRKMLKENKKLLKKSFKCNCDFEIYYKLIDYKTIKEYFNEKFEYKKELKKYKKAYRDKLCHLMSNICPI